IVTGGLGRLGSQYAAALTGAGAAGALFDITDRRPPRLIEFLGTRGPPAGDPVHAPDRAAGHPRGGTGAARFGGAPPLVHKAGLGSPPADAALETGRFECYPETAWDAMMASHLKSALVVSQSFVAAFRAAGRTRGSIVNVSSTYGMVTPDQSVYEYRRSGGAEDFKPIGYSGAKAGGVDFTPGLGEVCAAVGIRVTTLVPGGVREDAHAPEFVAQYIKRTPLGRMANDTDYNGAVVFLASQASAYMTGATLVVDGGWTAR